MVIAELAHSSGEVLLECLIWAIVLGLIVGGIAWFVPPTRAYAVAIGGVVALLTLLVCIV